jgi:hypothetical protein
VDRLVPAAVEALNEIMQLTPVNNLAGYDPAVENEGRPAEGPLQESVAQRLLLTFGLC